MQQQEPYPAIVIDEVWNIRIRNAGLDDIFFELKWAYWLKNTIPGAVEVVEVPDAKLFFPDDRPAALIEPLRRFLRSRS